MAKIRIGYALTLPTQNYGNIKPSLEIEVKDSIKTFELMKIKKRAKKIMDDLVNQHVEMYIENMKKISTIKRS